MLKRETTDVETVALLDGANGSFNLWHVLIGCGNVEVDVHF